MNNPLDSNREEPNLPSAFQRVSGRLESMTFTLKTCLICGQEYAPTGHNQKYCPNCKKEGKCRGRKAWRLENRERKIASDKRWKIAHPDRVKAWERTHPEDVRIERKKHKAKRRFLAFVSMNDSFNGCEAHHINDHDVIYIPKEMHRSIPHNVWTGKNMERINALACAWFTEDWT